jgi:flagellar biosynthesis/type III secretory pathway protein FliH
LSFQVKKPESHCGISILTDGSQSKLTGSDRQTHLLKVKRKKQGCGYNSVVEHLPRIHEVLGFISNARKKEREGRREEGREGGRKGGREEKREEGREEGRKKGEEKRGLKRQISSHH